MKRVLSFWLDLLSNEPSLTLAAVATCQTLPFFVPVRGSDVDTFGLYCSNSFQRFNRRECLKWMWATVSHMCRCTANHTKQLKRLIGTAKQSILELDLK